MKPIIHRAAARPRPTLFWLLLVGLALSLAGLQPALAQTRIIYVDANSAGLGDGSSWSSPLRNLQDALDEAEAGDQVWVARGVYRPVIAADPENISPALRMISFDLRQGVALYGGFSATEASLSERDWQANPTVLSGDIGGDDGVNEFGIVVDPIFINGKNSYSVVTGFDVDSSTVLDGFVITAGQTETQSGASFGPDVRGAGIYLQDAGPTLANLLVIGNLAIACSGIETIANTPVLEQVEFRRNNALTIGGGGCVGQAQNAQLHGLRFQGNRADAGGGGLLIDQGSVTLLSAQFIDNQVTSGSGGGLLAGIAQVTLEGGGFIGNGADIGAGLFADSVNLTVRDILFQDNNASLGGGGAATLAGALHMERVRLAGNVAGSAAIGGEGGGLSTELTEVDLENVLIAGNRSFGSGGGMEIRGADPASLVNTAFRGNRADGPGGGLAIWNNAGATTLTNASFAGNRAGGNGGGLINVASSPELRNTIIWSNSAAGSTSSASASIHNNEPGDQPLVRHSLVANSGGSGGWNAAIGTDGGGNLDADPDFVRAPAPGQAPTAVGSLWLMPGSPAIDSGNNSFVAGIEHDLAGAPRIVGPAVDIGAFEFVPFPEDFTAEPGNWFDPATEGHGLDLQRISQTDGSEVEIVTFYTYENDGTPAWYLGTGVIDENGLLDSGAGGFWRFTYDFAAGEQVLVPEDSGRMRIDFSDRAQFHPACTDGTPRDASAGLAVFGWELDGESGDWCVHPIVFNFDGRPSPNPTGHWFGGPADSGWGLTVDVRGGLGVVVLYYYDADGNPRWAWGAGPLSPQGGVMEMLEFSGYCRLCPLQLPLNTVPAGTVTLQFTQPSMSPAAGNTASVDVEYLGAEGGMWIRETVPIRLLSNPQVGD